MCQISPVPYHGDTIFCVEHQGNPFVPMKPIVENMGMGWARQSTKLNANKTRWTVAMKPIVAQDGKKREMLCLPLRKLPHGLPASIPKRCARNFGPKLSFIRLNRMTRFGTIG